ncbi:polyprenol phosphomannose-dependent alpha 1,6 mannosyltransferase MptB [Actinoplanes sp. NPDC051470]|uniref:polyprenol phosphomannose-dependent alpha 1,6 mannosyltransferase MptB n=1 Tax=Actinoplanes sp. NPDC051470 TaxID=3157224 RepID=UPI003447B863
MRRDHVALSRATGFGGSVLIAAGGLGAGALPVGIPFFAGGTNAQIGLVAVYSGLLLLVLGWWWYGKTGHFNSAAGRDEGGGGAADGWRTLALWSAPLLFTPPLFSRDVYSYLAQGQMVDAGLDVYHVGPSALGGAIADQIPAIWLDTPSPYGPVLLIVARLIAPPLTEHLLLGVIAMRLIAVGGLALLAVATRTLARSAGVRPASAAWLIVLNPLTLIHFVGGAHNDALMVGLLAAGLAAAVRRRPVVAVVLVVAAALVKAPAVLGLAAVAAIWAHQINGRFPRVRATAAVAGTAGVATALITAAAGTGYGWILALQTPMSPHNWSLTSGLGRVTASLLDGGISATLARDVWRWAGLLAMLIVAGLVWTYRAKLGPVYGLGLVLSAVVVFGPALRPWYLLWGLAPLAAAAVDQRVRQIFAGVCVVLAVAVLPDGFAPDANRVLLATIGGLIGIAAFITVRISSVLLTRAGALAQEAR